MDFLKPAADVLKRFYGEPARNLKLVLGGQLDREQGMTTADRHALTRVVYGVVRRDRQIEFLLKQVSSRN